MSFTKEEGGRLNAFAKEPEIEVIQENSSNSNTSTLILIGGGLLLFSLIAYTVSIS